MLEWFERRKEYVLVMERQRKAIDLFEAVKSDGIPEMIARRVFRQIAEAALHCHSNGVLHRDIKDSNILFNPVTFEAKLIDFGAGARLKVGRLRVNLIRVHFFCGTTRLFFNGEYTWTLAMAT